MIIRALTDFEREAVRKFYLSLSADDRRKRFCSTLTDDTISSYVDRLDFSRNTVLAAFDEQVQIVGLAELVRGEKSSEMAFSVRPDRRGQKIGTKLIQRLILRARICGISKVFVMFLSDNTPMRRMAIRAGMGLSVADGEAYAERELQVPGAQELAQWFVQESASQGEYFRTFGVVGWGSLAKPPANSPQEPIEALPPAA